MTKYTVFQKIISILVVVSLICLLTSCGGTKVLKKTQPLKNTQPLAKASDQNVSATLNWVIVRDGPGTWAKNADWDEYLISVDNESVEEIQITDVTIVDSLGVKLASSADYNELVDASKQTTKRYKDSNLKVKAGIGIGTVLTVTGASLVGAGAGAVAAAPAAFMASGAVVGAAAAAGAILVLVPAAIGVGTVRYINRNKVSKEIEKRHTAFPVIIKSDENLFLDVFFPLAPSPTQLEINYIVAGLKETLVINTSEALNGLHLVHEE
jgi:hypothetical protein